MASFIWGEEKSKGGARFFVSVFVFVLHIVNPRPLCEMHVRATCSLCRAHERHSLRPLWPS